MSNRYIGVNFIPDNPRMAVPPEFFLQRLYDFDADLVMLPSRHVPFAYVLGRRRRYTAGLTDRAVAEASKQPDTIMCMNYGLVPVTLIYQLGSVWNADPIIRSLQARDIWAHGGADKFADKLDEADASLEKKVKQDSKRDMWDRSGDAWRSYQARTGQRTRPTLGSSAPILGTQDPNSRTGTANQ